MLGCGCFDCFAVDVAGTVIVKSFVALWMISPIDHVIRLKYSESSSELKLNKNNVQGLERALIFSTSP